MPSSAGALGTRGVDRRAGVAGFLAAALALSVAEVVDAVSTAAPSLVVVVGQAFIRAAPPGFGRSAVEAVGTNDKPLVVAGTVVLALLIGVWVGRAARRRPPVGDAAAVVFAGLAVACATRLPQFSVAGTAMAGLFAAGAGAVALRVLLHPLAAPIAGDTGDPLPIGSAASRRRFLVAGSSVGMGTGLALFVARGVKLGSGAAPGRELPAPADPLPAAAGSGVDVEGLSPLVTPTERFFRIDEALVPPLVNAGRWRLAVTGMVDRPFELTYDELLAEPLVERLITLACVSNEVGGPLVGTTRWLGVRLDRFLDRAGVQAGATQVVGRSVDGFTTGFPIEAATGGRDSLVAVGMDGRALPRKHGFPARLVVPGLYGYVSATKWLTEIELTTWEAFDAYWVRRGWAERAPVKVQSRIDVPGHTSRVAPGRRPLAGVAWAPGRGIARVEVNVDGAGWRGVTLATSFGDDAWRQWSGEWTATPGRHQIAVRATTAGGEVQTGVRERPFPDGATGHHTVEVWVTG